MDDSITLLQVGWSTVCSTFQATLQSYNQRRVEGKHREGWFHLFIFSKITLVLDLEFVEH